MPTRPEYKATQSLSSEVPHEIAFIEHFPQLTRFLEENKISKLVDHFLNEFGDDGRKAYFAYYDYLNK